ncbi:hypothetical protein [Azonexus hydrophilus]|uniref:hypothetical protein n=1 Tax=Azonexus hydrophilus TaxID=418702 RepID=UPI0005BC6D29|nr:hypothetical protein [Azonexus hydrophilus]
MKQTNRDRQRARAERVKRERAEWEAKNQHIIQQVEDDLDQLVGTRRTRLSARRRYAEKQAKPKWFEADKVKMMYEKRDELNERLGLKLEVDHIIPIQSSTVCGLHCWANLQLLDADLNGVKTNDYQQDW